MYIPIQYMWELGKNKTQTIITINNYRDKRNRTRRRTNFEVSALLTSTFLFYHHTLRSVTGQHSLQTCLAVYVNQK